MTASHQHYREACTRCNDKDIEISKLKADLVRFQKAASRVIAVADKMELDVGKPVSKSEKNPLQTTTARHIFGGLVFGSVCGLVLTGAGLLLAASTSVQITAGVLLGIAALVSMVAAVASS